MTDARRRATGGRPEDAAADTTTYSFSKVGFVFLMPESKAVLTSSLCSMAEFQMRVYLRSAVDGDGRLEAEPVREANEFG